MTALVTPGGGYCVAVPGQDAVDLVPGLPQPERPGNGPSVRLLDTGDAVHCSLGACWPIEEEWLRRELPGRLGLSGRATQLRVAVLGTPTLTLAVAATAGAPPSPLAEVPTSGYPPYTAILNLPLGPDAAAALRAAAEGRPGRAFVVVRAHVAPDLVREPAWRDTVLTDVDATTITATADLADWLQPPTRKESPSC